MERRDRPERRTGKERRENLRRRVRLFGNLVDPDNEHNAVCLIRDASVEGCKIYSGFLHQFPDNVMIQLEGLSGPAPGTIAWREGNLAGIRFRFENAE